MPTAAWPMLLHDPPHSGRGAAFGPASYASDWSCPGLGAFGSVAIGAEGEIFFGSSDGHAYCYDLAGSQVWAYEGSYPFRVNPPAIGESGTVYVANGDVVALDPATGAPKWTFSRPTPTTLISAPLALGANERVYALTTTASGQPNELFAIDGGTATWKVPLPRPSSSTPAIAADGTILLGCQDGVLRALDPAGGSLKWSWSEAGAALPMPPAIGPDGTVYVGVQGYPVEKNALVALTPPASGQSQPTVRWRYVPSPGEYLSGLGAPALAPDGTVYAGFEALHAIDRNGNKRWASTATASETSPGPPAVGIDGAVHFVTAAGTLWALDPEGSLRWQTPGAAPATAPALAETSAVYFGDGVDALKASAAAPPLSPRLTAFYQALLAARKPTSPGMWSYPLSPQTISDAPLLELVTGATGGGTSVTVIGPDLAVAEEKLTLSGTVTFLGVSVPARFVFSMAGETAVTLTATATMGSGFKLSSSFPVLAETIFEKVAFEGAVLEQVATTSWSPASRTWSLSGSTDPTTGESPLAEAASMLGVSGPVALAAGSTIAVSDGVPVVDLSFAGSHPLELGEEISLECKLGLETSIVDPASGSFLASVLVTSQLTVGGHSLAIRAEIPPSPGLAVLTAEPAVGEQPNIKLSDLNLWKGPQTELTAAVPSSMEGSGQTFGLQQLAIGFLTDKTVSWISFRIGAPDWPVLAAGGVGVDLTVKKVGIDVTCMNPFQSPSVYARLSGTIETTIHTQSGQSTAAFEIGAVAPDFQLFGQLVPGTQVKFLDLVSAVAGTEVTPPTGVPSPVLDALSLYAQPQFGTFNFKAAGDLNWTLFEIDSVEFALRRFGIELDRIQTANDSSHPAIAATLKGTILLGDFEFELGGSSPAGDEGWAFSANLGAPVALPTIGSLVSTFNPAWAQALPSSVASAGQDIELKVLQLEVDASPASHKVLRTTIGTAADWAGWTVIDSPRLALKAVDVDLTADSSAGFSGAIRGGFQLGEGTIAVAVPMPFSSGKFTLAYDSGEEGLTLPSIGSIVSWVEPAWGLPQEVASIGSGIDLDRFTFTVTVEGSDRTVDVVVKAAEPDHKWVLIAAGGKTLLALQSIAVELHDAKTTSGSIAGTVLIGSGSLPLRATMQDSWRSYTIGLDTQTSPARLPTLREIVSLLSTTIADAIPEPMGSWGSGIEVTKFQVAVNESGGTTTASIEAAVGEPAGSLPWAPISLMPSFKLHGLAVQAAGNVGAIPEVSLTGTLEIGQHGHIPLKAGFSSQMQKVAIALDPSGGPATLPTIADVAELFVGSWAQALPDAIGSLGQSFSFQRLDLGYDGSNPPATWSVVVAIGTEPGWGGYAPIPAVPSLRFTSFSIAFEQTSSKGPKGKLESSVEVLGKTAVFELDLPEAVFKATLETGVTLTALVQYVIGTDALPLPSWLESLGLPKIQLEAAFKTEIYTLRAVLAEDISLPGGGALKQASLLGELGGPGDPKVCFETIWETPGGEEVPGRICYPFEDFFPEADPDNPVEDFPPEEPPQEPSPDWEKTTEIIDRVIKGGATAAEAAAIAYYGYNALGALVGGALLANGITLLVMAKALHDTWPTDRNNPTALATDLQTAAQKGLGKTLTPSEFGTTLAGTFDNLTVGELAAALADAISTIKARQMVEGLKAGGFQPHQISPELRSRYAPPAGTMVTELQQGWSPDQISAAEMAASLAAAPYSAVEAAPPLRSAYPNETKTGPELAQLLIAAGFQPPLDPAGMATALAAASFDAPEATAGLMAAFPTLVKKSVDAVPFLRQAGYAATAVALVILSELKTAAEMAKVLSGGGYTAPQAAPALRASYPGEVTSASVLLGVLVGAWTGLSAAVAAEALAGAAYPAPATAKALHDSPVFTASVGTAAAMTTVLKGAYPAIGMAELLVALAGVPFPAFAAALAAIPPGTPLASAEAALTASAAYPDLELLPLAAALANAGYGAADVDAGLCARWPQAPKLARGRAAAAVTRTDFTTALAAAATAEAAGVNAAAAARQIVTAQPALPSDSLAAAIAAAFPLAPPALNALARAIIPAYTQPDAEALALTLLVAAPESSPSPVASALLAGFKAASNLPVALAAAAALANAFARIGSPTSESPLAAALAAAYAEAGSPLDPQGLAAALRAAFGATTIAKVVEALKGAYEPPCLPPAAAAAAAGAFAVPPGQPLELARAIAATYGLERCPVDTGAISLAMKVAEMEFKDVSGAFRQILKNWTVDQYGLLVRIYQEQSWSDAWLAASGGETVPQAAQSLKQRYGAEAAELVAWLVAGYDLTAPLAAATPIATGLKQAGVAEAAALTAFEGFFGSEWTAQAAAVVRAVYQGQADNDKEAPMAQSAEKAEIEAVVAEAPDLHTAAWGCKNGGFTPAECAPELHARFPSAGAGEMAAAIVNVWACEASTAAIEAALAKCNAWSSGEINAAATTNLSLTWHDLARFKDASSKPTNLKEVGLFQGDLTAMTSAEAVSVLVISALPGDYTPTPGSMIGALAQKGVSVEQLAKSPAVDMRSEYKCWLSQQIQGQSFGQLLVLETTGAEAAANIPGVFHGLAKALPNPPDNLTAASSMLSTGSAGAQPAEVLRALFEAAKASMEGGFGLTGLKIVVFDSSWVSSLVTEFDQLKGGASGA